MQNNNQSNYQGSELQKSIIACNDSDKLGHKKGYISGALRYWNNKGDTMQILFFQDAMQEINDKINLI